MYSSMGFDKCIKMTGIHHYCFTQNSFIYASFIHPSLLTPPPELLATTDLFFVTVVLHPNSTLKQISYHLFRQIPFFLKMKKECPHYFAVRKYSQMEVSELAVVLFTGQVAFPTLIYLQ